MKRFHLWILLWAVVVIGIFHEKSFSESSRGKIALLFLTRSDPHHPRLWQTLLEEGGDNFAVYVHSSEPMMNPFFKNYRIPKIVSTSWSIHVRAWQELIKEALKNPDNKKFVFLSESCVPLYSLSHIYDVLMKNGHTHMAFGRSWWQNESPRTVFEIDPEYRWGNTEWMVLNRRHAEIVAKDKAIIKLISRHENDQESYFSTLFSLHDCLQECVNHSYTYVDWTHAENGGASPHTFAGVDDLNNSLIAHAYSIKALFARKFSKEYPEGTLIQMIRDGPNSNYKKDR